MAILKFLIITLLVFYLIRVIFRLLFPVLLKKMFSKVQQQAQNHAQQQSTRPEGSISIDYMPPEPKGKGNSDKLGDFVDYEEVK